MKLDGHAKLTNTAIEKFVQLGNTDPQLKKLLLKLPSFSTYKGGEFEHEKYSTFEDNINLVFDNIINQLLPGLYSGFPLKGRLVRHVVGIDMDAAYIRGHGKEWGQPYHFMKTAYDSSQTGYIKACDFIKINTGDWVNITLRRLSNKATVINPYLQSDAAQSLALAIHSLQDSFSISHTRRDISHNSYSPGAIREVYVYAGQDKKDHSNKDYLTGATSSINGLMAINATVDLLKICTEAVLNEYYILRNWDNFKNKWLRFQQ